MSVYIYPASFFTKYFLLAATAVFLVSHLPRPTTALPLSDVINDAWKNDARRVHHRDRRNVEDPECQQPTGLQKMFEELNSNINTTQFLQPFKPGNVLSDSSRAHFITDDNENQTCPNTYSRIHTASVNHRSLCPYYFDILQFPQGYYPASLQWARCKCEKCIEHPALSCVPITTPLTVLKPNGCRLGMQLYEEYVIPGGVNIACTCAYTGRTTQAGSILPNFSGSHVPDFGQE